MLSASYQANVVRRARRAAAPARTAAARALAAARRGGRGRRGRRRRGGGARRERRRSRRARTAANDGGGDGELDWGAAPSAAARRGLGALEAVLAELRARGAERGGGPCLVVLDHADDLRHGDLLVLLGKLLGEAPAARVLLTAAAPLALPDEIALEVGAHEAVVALGPLALRSTARLFTRQCPHLHTALERRAFLREVVAPDQADVTVFSADCRASARRMLEMLGDGWPGAILKLAYEQSAEDFAHARGRWRAPRRRRRRPRGGHARRGARGRRRRPTPAPPPASLGATPPPAALGATPPPLRRGVDVATSPMPSRAGAAPAPAPAALAAGFGTFRPTRRHPRSRPAPPLVGAAGRVPPPPLPPPPRPSALTRGTTPPVSLGAGVGMSDDDDDDDLGAGGRAAAPR